ncbi:hypothetical protein B0H14DRAFT_2574144 [Mycena olivaceomarginata]|nr:hypothetical protein B0H14DRAFT_2574144 [Mycena olivaceomarginata]
MEHRSPTSTHLSYRHLRPLVNTGGCRGSAAAALQLEAIVTPPHVSVLRIVSGHFKSAALRICLESGVTEILREAGPQGIHVKDIAAKNGQHPEKLGSAFFRNWL